MVVPILLAIAYVLGVNTGIQGFSMAAIAFFTIGAYFGIAKLNFVKMSGSLLKFIGVIYVTLLMGIVMFMGNNNEQTSIIRLGVFIGVFMAIGIASYLVERHSFKISAFLTGSTFFIFASHSEILIISIRLTSRIGIESDLFYCLAYFICPMITLIILLYVYRVLTKTMPRVASVLCGGR